MAKTQEEIIDEMNLDAGYKSILLVLEKPKTIAGVAAARNLSYQTARDKLAILAEMGLITKHKSEMTGKVIFIRNNIEVE